MVGCERVSDSSEKPTAHLFFIKINMEMGEDLQRIARCMANAKIIGLGL